MEIIKNEKPDEIIYHLSESVELRNGLIKTFEGIKILNMNNDIDESILEKVFNDYYEIYINFENRTLETLTSIINELEKGIK